MNSLLKFDGPNLEDLLARVQRELGPQVTILEANRTRKGGIGGFFAREWFEVIVDGASVAAEPAAPAASGSAPAATGSAPADQVSAEPDPFLALAAAVDDSHETARSVDRAGPPTGEKAAVTKAPAVKDRAATAFELVLAGAHRDQVVRPGETAIANGLVLDPTPPLNAAAPMSTESWTGVKDLAAAVSPPPARRLRDLDLPDLLGHLDPMVPTDLLPRGEAPVIAVVGDPNQVRQVAASVAAMVGLGETDVLVAAPEPTDVSPWLALSDPSTAQARARRWREADHPTVVAVELSPGADGHAWAAAMLEAMEADQVRLVAKAWQLTDQLGAKAQALGGIDGLDLIEMEAAAEPELFLELDLAVLAIDGRPATAELWAALMYERRMDERHQ